MRRWVLGDEGLLEGGKSFHGYDIIMTSLQLFPQISKTTVFSKGMECYYSINSITFWLF